LEVIGIILLMAAFALGSALYMRFYFKPTFTRDDDDKLDL
jgi:hypothetical protein